MNNLHKKLTIATLYFLEHPEKEWEPVSKLCDENDLVLLPIGSKYTENENPFTLKSGGEVYTAEISQVDWSKMLETQKGKIEAQYEEFENVKAKADDNLGWLKQVASWDYGIWYDKDKGFPSKEEFVSKTLSLAPYFLVSESMPLLENLSHKDFMIILASQPTGSRITAYTVRYK